MVSPELRKRQGFEVVPSAFSLYPSAFTLQPSAFSLQPLTFNLSPFPILHFIAPVIKQLNQAA